MKNSILIHWIGIVIFASLSLFFSKELYFFKSKQNIHFPSYEKLYNSSTLGYVEKVEKIDENVKKITYSYQVANYWYKNTQNINQKVAIASQDKVQVKFDGFDCFDSCVVAKLPSSGSVFHWVLLFVTFLSSVIAFFHFSIKIYDYFNIRRLF